MAIVLDMTNARITGSTAVGGDTSITSTTDATRGNVVLENLLDTEIVLGDAAGANKLSILDSSPAEVASINSDGDISGDGSLTMGGDGTFTGDIVCDDMEVASTGSYYLGDQTTDGSWRIVRDGNNLHFERREGGAWVAKSQMTP